MRNLKENSKRRREKHLAFLLVGVILIFTGLEIYLARLSAQLPFVNSIFFFGLMNINIILIMLLLFLIFRNSVKLLLDQRRGKFGSRLRTKLVFLFVLFAIIPTILLFSISAFYIKSSFDSWFSERISGTLRRSLDVAEHYYENTKANALHFAARVADELPPSRLEDSENLKGHLDRLRAKYSLDGIEIFSGPFSARILSASKDNTIHIPSPSIETLKRHFAQSKQCKVLQVGMGELVRCGAPLKNGGIVFADYFIPMNLAANLSEIALNYEDYKSSPLSYPIKSTYFGILIMMTLLIIFCALWTGFYAAKRLSDPIESLSRGTLEVAKGNLNYKIPESGSDELGKLIWSFNQMISELNRRSHYIDVLLGSVQSGVLSLDDKGKITTVNPAAARLLQLSQDQIVGKPYWAIIPEEHRAEFRELLSQVQNSSKTIRREIKIRTENRKLTIILTVSLLKQPDAPNLGVVAVFDDVTEIQEVERMAAWREVARRIAHEIKNPLTPIQLSVQRLRKRYLNQIQDEGIFAESTQIILSEVDALKRLVTEFTNFARLPEVEKREEDINDVVVEAVNLFRAAHEGLQFDLLFGSDLPKMRVDRSLLKRALINLFDNAVTAMESKGKVTVKTELASTGTMLLLTIADEGCGIDPAIRETVFEPYVSTKPGGTGLGLAIVNRILSDHQAVIQVLPNNPRGTQFVIQFPVEIGIVGSFLEGKPSDHRPSTHS